MQNRNNNTVQANVSSTGPKGEAVFEAVHGKVRGTVWKNFSGNTGKHYFKGSIRRIETDGEGKVHLANSFWPEDFKDVAAAITACRIWLQDNTDAFERQREWRKDNKMKRSNKPKASKAESPDSKE